MLPIPDLPPLPPRAGVEMDLLAAFLDRQRGVLLRKVGGLPEEALRHPGTPSGVSLVGLLKHSAYVERWWFQAMFAGEYVDFPWTDEDPDADWRVEPGETAEDVRALYLDEVERSRAIAADASLDGVARNPDAEGITMRAILLHMIEEVARHLGHADVIREHLDGATGD